MLPLLEELEDCLPVSTPEGEISAVIDRFLSDAEETNRRLFVRRYFYCDSIRMLARRFGLSEGAIKLRLYRMREALRAELEKEEIDV